MSKKTLLNIMVAILLMVFLFNAGDLGKWIFVGLLACVAVRILIYVVGLYAAYLRNRSSFQREYFLKMTAWMMVFFFFTGTLLFMFVIPFQGDDGDRHIFNNVELMLRSMICSLDMFMLDVDSNILDNLKGHPLLKGLILIQATFSFVCTITLLASLIFSRLKAYYVLHRKTRITAEKNHLYLFFGIDENSRLLAKDVAEHDPKSLSIFVDEANLNDDDSDSWENIVTLFTHRHRTFEIAEDAHALVAIGSKNLSDIPDAGLERAEVDIFSMVGLRKVRQLIESLPKYGPGAQLHMFFLSDDEDRNIRSLFNLAKDRLILSTAASEKVEHQIYCHVRFNGPNRIVEDLAVRKHLNVEIVDSSHLAVELMKADPDDQPIRTAYLSKEYPATVERPLECLIVGFGEVGRDSFRFLYEFGSFIQMTDGKPNEAKPHITAVDSKMKKIEGLFRVHMPALSFNEEKGPLQLLNLDWHEHEFFSKCLSPEKCRSLNYVVLALGDDDSNILLAATLFQLIRRHREDMSHLVIMVRCVRPEKMEMMRKVAAHYNKGCGLRDHEVIRLFGNPEKIYSYHTIIKEDLTRRGQTFYDNYTLLRGKAPDWKGRRDELTAVTVSESGEIGYPDLDNLRRLRRQEGQDLANALHASTKIWLLREALGKDCDWIKFVAGIFNQDGTPYKNGKYTSVSYPGLSHEENEIMHRLAMLEHARWNSAHELLGYMVNDESHRCEERIQLHNCLRPWEQLEDESRKASAPGWDCDYISYDFSVVDTSIALDVDAGRNHRNLK